MALTRTSNSIAAPITSTLLLDGLRVGMQNAGFGSRISTYTSGNETRDIYETDYGTGQTYSKSYLQTRVNSSALLVSAALYWSWNVSNNTGSADPAVTSSNMTVNTSTSVNFVALNGGHEFRALIIVQGTSIGAIQLLRPSLRPAWWTDNDFPYFFIGSNITGGSQFLNYSSTGGNSLNPFLSVSARLRPVQMQGINHLSQRQVLTHPYLETTSTPTNQGVLGQFGADLGQCSGNNASIFDLIEVLPGVNEWAILNPSNGGLAVRIV